MSARFATLVREHGGDERAARDAVLREPVLLTCNDNALPKRLAGLAALGAMAVRA